MSNQSNDSENVYEAWRKYTKDTEAEIRSFLRKNKFKEMTSITSAEMQVVHFTNDEHTDVVIFIVRNNQRSHNFGVTVKSTDTDLCDKCNEIITHSKVRAIEQIMAENRMRNILAGEE